MFPERILFVFPSTYYIFLNFLSLCHEQILQLLASLKKRVQCLSLNITILKFIKTFLYKYDFNGAQLLLCHYKISMTKKTRKNFLLDVELAPAGCYLLKIFWFVLLRSDNIIIIIIIITKAELVAGGHINRSCRYLFGKCYDCINPKSA